MVSFDEIWGKAKESLNSGLADLEKVGKPALVATLADQGIAILQAQKKASEGALDAGVKEIAQRPSDPNSFASKFVAKIQNPVVKQYGGPAIVAIAALVVVGFIIKRG